MPVAAFLFNFTVTVYSIGNHRSQQHLENAVATGSRPFSPGRAASVVPNCAAAVGDRFRIRPRRSRKLFSVANCRVFHSHWAFFLQPGHRLFEHTASARTVIGNIRFRASEYRRVPKPVPSSVARASNETNDLPAAAFLRSRAPPLVAQEMFQGGEQKRPELSAFAVRLFQPLLLQQPTKETLCQITRLFRLVAPVGAHERRLPPRARILQSDSNAAVPLERSAARRSPDHAPMCGREKAGV